MNTFRASCVVLFLVALLAACREDPAGAAAKLVATGNNYLENGKYKEASIIYRRAIQQDRRNAEAYHRLGLAEFRLGRMRQAMGALTRALELDPANEDAYSRLADIYLSVYLVNRDRFGQYLEELQAATDRFEQHRPNSFPANRLRGLVAISLPNPDYRAALEYLQRAENQQPGDRHVALALVECLFQTAEPAKAFETARMFIARDKTFAAMYDLLYVQCARAQRFNEARDILLEKIANNPNEIHYRLQLARHYLGTREREPMEAVLKELLANRQQFPDAPRAVGDFYVRIQAYDPAFEVYRAGAEAVPARKREFQNRMVEVLAIQGRFDEAFNLVERILQEDDDDPAALALRGAIRLRTRRREELSAAIADIEAALVRMPDNPVLRYNLAEAHRAQGNLDRSRLEYEAAIEKRPDYLPARYRLADLHLTRGEYPQAVSAAETILVFQPGNLRAHLIRAAAWMRMGETTQARETLRRITEQEPSARDAMYMLGRLELRDSRFAEAEALFRRLYEGPPPDHRGMLGLVDCYLLQGNPGQAVALLESSIAERPDDLGLKLALGSTFHLAGRFDDAIRVVSEVLRQRPDDGIAHRLLGGAYYDKGDFAQAEPHLRRSAETLPSDPVPKLYLGMMAERSGALQQAAAHYQAVLEVAPDNAIALNNLAYILAETTTDLDGALTHIQRARSLAPSDPNIADTLAYVYLKRNLPDSARPLLEEIVAKYPGVVVWRYHLALALAQQGRAEEARGHLRIAMGNRPTEEEKYKIDELLKKIGG